MSGSRSIDSTCQEIDWQELAASAAPDLRGQLESALAAFGASVLTERECQTVQLVLQGYSTKAISSQLAIAVETAKLHRKNAYAKLAVSTQGELFNLFINALISVDAGHTGDPLLSYPRSYK